MDQREMDIKQTIRDEIMRHVMLDKEEKQKQNQTKNYENQGQQQLIRMASAATSVEDQN